MEKEQYSPASEVNTPKGQEIVVLRLYIADTTQRTHEAVVNITKLCEEHLGKGNYDLEIVNISEHPEKAKEANIIAVPTLIKRFPLPLRRFIGDMTKTERILIGLDVRTA